VSKKTLYVGITTGLAGMIIGIAATVAVAKQEHMAEAMHHLEGAKQELQQADADKGGHRDKALELVNQAMEQVHAGMEFAKEHHEGDHDQH
jgi:hypothetical protein